MNTTPYGNTLQLLGSLGLSIYEVDKALQNTKALMEELLRDISAGGTCLSLGILKNIGVCVWDMQVALETIDTIVQEHKITEA